MTSETAQQPSTPEAGQPTPRSVGYVAIGRNEGARLERCLDALKLISEHVVYVDSGSHDASVMQARARDIETIELSADKPFSAARARNEGAEHLTTRWPDITHIQFIDGDCELEAAFPAKALARFYEDENIALVTGFCREAHPEASLYNLICDIEWRGPVGTIDACGGIFMIRRDVFEQVGGFDPGVIAAEDDDLCIRVRAEGFYLERIDATMCWHDANMHHFSQWWRRAERAGHAYALVGARHPGYFKGQKRRAIIFGGILPLLFATSLIVFGAWALVLLIPFGLSFARLWQRYRRDAATKPKAGSFAGLMVLSKIPNFLGMIGYWWKHRTGKTVNIIEYK